MILLASHPVIAAIAAEDDLQGWKTTARSLLSRSVPPEEVLWRTEGGSDLFAGCRQTEQVPASKKISLPRKAVKLVDTAIHHSSPDRFSLLYRFLWRAERDRSLPDNMADPDTVQVQKLEKAVRRDAHKMHAFVRFRKVGEKGGREQFASWFEPDHHIVEREAPFFMRRFANMDWVIVTPRRTAVYKDGEISFRHGGRREDVPADDAFEDAWRAYYASIFNPARIMTDAMRAEMPKKYWKNLPEASMIPGLLEQAPGRVSQMAKAAAENKQVKISREMVAPAPRRASIDALHDAVRRFKPPSGLTTRHVTGEGPPGAALFLVGEQPGEHEDRAGRPFVGPAGQLLNQHLEAAGIDRCSAYVTNAVKRFNFTERGRRRIHQTPKAGEIDLWAPFLFEEHQLIKPKVTIALGATALRGFFRRPVKLGEVRGEVIDLAPEMGGVCIPTFHPSYLLRLQDEGQRQVETRKFRADLEKARDLALV